MDCRDGKILNPHTCVFVKECKPGFRRNEKFQCRKGTAKSNATVKSKAKSKANVSAANVSKAKNDSKPLRKFTSKAISATKSATNAKSNVNAPTNMTTDYDEDTVFVFYSKSADVAPGKGKNETIPAEKREMYADLEKIPDWRKRLSNFWIQPFYKDGYEWASVEHSYQASKFKKNNREFYKLFSLDSKSELSKDASLAKATGGKDLKHKYRPSEIAIDSDFFPDRAKEEMFLAQHAKFTQSVNLSHLLKSTKKAKLMHYTRGGKLELFDSLMYIRDHLK